MRKRIKKGVACVLCASMVAALLGGCSSKNAESSKPSIHIESYTKVGYDTVTVQSGDISPILNLKLSRMNLKRKIIKFHRMITK